MFLLCRYISSICIQVHIHINFSYHVLYFNLLYKLYNIIGHQNRIVSQNRVKWLICSYFKNLIWIKWTKGAHLFREGAQSYSVHLIDYIAISPNNQIDKTYFIYWLCNKAKKRQAPKINTEIKMDTYNSF